MANTRFIFGDILTGAIVADIPLYGVSMAKAMASGELRGSFQFDQTGRDNATLDAATVPGRCFVVCERESFPIWGGIVWTRTYQSQAKVNQLYCRGFEHYPARRLIRADRSWTATEKRNIFLDLWQDMQADANSIRINLPSDFSDAVLTDFEVKASEFKTYRDAMDELANTDDGFDWTVDVNRIDNAYIFTLRVGTPFIGNTNPANAITFDYPGSITNYWLNESMSGSGTHIYGIGAGEGSTMLSVEAIHTDLLAQNFPRYDVDVSMKAISDINVLTPLTIQAAQLRRALAPVLTVETKADKHPQFMSYSLGDLSNITMQDPKHPDPASQTVSKRLIGWEYYPASADGVELSRLAFDGDDI